jgi:hypothetical protein
MGEWGEVKKKLGHGKDGREMTGKHINNIFLLL